MRLLGPPWLTKLLRPLSDYSRPGSAASGGWRQQHGDTQTETEEQIRRRQKVRCGYYLHYLQYLRIQAQLDNFYKSIDQTKETQLRVDLESRKHHDTLLPNQKSPIPHNRWGGVKLLEPKPFNI